MKPNTKRECSTSCNRQSQKLGRFSTVTLILCLILFIGGAVSLFLVNDDSAVSRIAFQMFETFLMMVIIFIPKMLDRIVHIRLPKVMEIIFVAFCFCSLILGDVADFYGKFHWWDDLQHGISGILLGILGYSLINTFNSVDGTKIKFSPLFVSLWVISFALSVGAIWEIIEFVTDGLFGLNSQQFLEGSGTFDEAAPLVGHEALRDTMEDLMLDLAGSLIISIIGFFDLKKQRNRISSITLDKTTSNRKS